MVSLLQKKRLSYHPIVPHLLRDLNRLALVPLGVAKPLAGPLRKFFSKTHDLPSFGVERKEGKPSRSLKVGVLFSGGQAAGGHNVISGLFDGLRNIHVESQLIGFLDGPAGLIEGRWRELTESDVDAVRNQGGFDLIGSSRTKIEKSEQFQAVAGNVKGLDAVVVIGGDDSNTNAAFLAEYFLQHDVFTRVIGVPKTIDGDLRSEEIEISFGFDSACKTYSELIGNIARDALSAKKYYHFIKLMGRSASHIALECALATQPNLTLIGEEKKSLSQIVQELSDLVVRRKELGKDFGVVLLPEGLIEFIPELQELIVSLNHVLAGEKDAQKVPSLLAEEQSRLLASLPEKIQKQLLFERDPHGNVQVSQIETEQLLMELVKKELKNRGVKFSALHHFFGYEGRCCFPSNFDANYGYSLGLLAALAAREEVTGVILAVRNLCGSPLEWKPCAVPINCLMQVELRSGKEKPVVAKTLVDLRSGGYLRFAENRKAWMFEDLYQTPGPIQFFGDSELTDSVPVSIRSIVNN